MDCNPSPVRQVTLTETVTREDCGTGWLRVEDGCRYFDVSIGGDWRGAVTLEIRPAEVSLKCPGHLEIFCGNMWKLFHLDGDADVRLWVRKGDFQEGEMTLELGN